MLISSIIMKDRKYISELGGRNVIFVLNKSDLAEAVDDGDIPAPLIHVSAKSNEGVDGVKELIYELACEDSAITAGLNASAVQLKELDGSLDALREAEDSLVCCAGEDITAGLLSSARVSILRVLGLDAGDELLDSMFSRFCVGK